MKTLRKKGSGRTKGSISFCSMKRVDMIKLLLKIPDDGLVVISRKWKDRIAQMGFDTSKARRIKKLSVFNGLTRK